MEGPAEPWRCRAARYIVEILIQEKSDPSFQVDRGPWKSIDVGFSTATVCSPFLAGGRAALLHTVSVYLSSKDLLLNRVESAPALPPKKVRRVSLFLINPLPPSPQWPSRVSLLGFCPSLTFVGISSCPMTSVDRFMPHARVFPGLKRLSSVNDKQGLA
jgi:hypothetical protein